MSEESHATCIFGSGTVERAWDPVLSAIRSHDDFNAVTLPETANFAMARLVFLARFIHQRGLDQDMLEREAEFLDAYEGVTSTMNDLRRRIAERIKQAEHEQQLTVRAEFRNVVAKLVEREVDSAHFLTTNWDGAVQRALSAMQTDFNVLHVHGHVDDPQHLYLPAEIANEPYRTPEDRQHSEQQHRTLMQCVDQSTHLFLYGLSLSPLDAELSQMIASGAHESGLREITVVDPDHARVIERVRTLLSPRSNDINIYGYHPARLLAGDVTHVIHPRRSAPAALNPSPGGL